MSLVLYPAIDIRGGQCVRLTQGDYEAETVYEQDPLKVARRFVAAGAEWIHVVDLDGAREGKLHNLQVIAKIAALKDVKVQVGGGVRNMERLEQLLSLGVERAIIGSAAIDDPAFAEAALQEYGQRVVIGIDAREGKVATHGWLNTSEMSAEACAREMVARGAKTFIFTDIARDGMLSGVNVEAVQRLAKACGEQVIASGGVKSLEDLRQLARLEQEGIAGVIIGKALYTGAFSLSEALQAVAEVNAS